VVVIIQARMGSTRLPGKVLMDIGGRTMLARTVRRAGWATLVDEAVVATTTATGDDAILDECARLGVAVFRGSEDDVLDRYYGAAQEHQAEAVVRVTSDCPFIDPGLIDRAARAFLEERPDYASNTLERTYPRGLDTEILTKEALERAWIEAREPHQRAHVTPYIYLNPDRFHLLSVTGDRDLSAHRWTVDTPEDIEFARAVYGRLGNGDSFTWEEALADVETDPRLVQVNSGIQQKSLEEG